MSGARVGASPVWHHPALLRLAARGRITVIFGRRPISSATKDHIVIEARDASPLADLIRAQAFPQSDDLRAQSFAAEFMLETDHLVTLQAGAKAHEPLLVTFADFRKLIQPHSRGGRAQVGGPAIPLPRLGQVGIECDDAETLQHSRIVSLAESNR